MLDPAAERYLAALVDRLVEDLGARLVSAYVIGSGVLGDWVPERSDLDVLVVCAGRLPRAVAERFVARLWHAELPCPARGLELVAYRRDVLAAPGPTVDFEVNLNTGRGMADRVSFDPGEEPRHWFLLDVAIAHTSARPLIGPPPGEVIGPVARRHALAALDASLRWHAAAEPGGANTVLNACRGLRYAADGAWVSKPVAGRWALERVAGADVVRAALALHAGGGGEAALDPAAVEALLAEVRAAVRRAQAPEG